MFKEYYKHNKHPPKEQQELRRARLLEEQKKKRALEHDEQRFHYQEAPAAVSTAPFHKQRSTFKQAFKCDFSLQLSEWMYACPVDLSEWLLVPCPRGQRCFVVACNGRTAMYNKSGRFAFAFRSLLSTSSARRQNLTLLDCVYVREQHTFYVLDMLHFGAQDMVDCEAQFRFYWMRSRFEEIEGIGEKSASNEKAFRVLQHYELDDAEQVAAVLQTYPVWPNNCPELDGLLFYHKAASYTSGETPLVCWLFAFMVPDVLGMQVSAQYSKPADYRHPLQYIKDFQERQVRRRALKPEKCGPMDVENLLEVVASEQQLELGLVDDEEELPHCDTGVRP